jgi:hypothetical protein
LRRGRRAAAEGGAQTAPKSCVKPAPDFRSRPSPSRRRTIS